MGHIFLRELNVIGWDILLACCGAWNVSYGSPVVPDKLISRARAVPPHALHMAMADEVGHSAGGRVQTLR